MRSSAHSAGAASASWGCRQSGSTRSPAPPAAARLRPLLPAHLWPGPVPLGAAGAGPPARCADPADRGLPRGPSAFRQRRSPSGIYRRCDRSAADRRLRDPGAHHGAAPDPDRQPASLLALTAARRPHGLPHRSYRAAFAGQSRSVASAPARRHTRSRLMCDIGVRALGVGQCIQEILHRPATANSSTTCAPDSAIGICRPAMRASRSVIGLRLRKRAHSRRYVRQTGRSVWLPLSHVNGYSAR